MEVKMEKEPESIVGKPEYAASEYSATSEAPPAYKLRQANSVKIAKIIAFTVILSSIILGSFMLGSTYLQAKATCDQVSALDAVLDKELMLEAMQQDLPHSEALQSRELNNNVAQDLSKDEMNKPNSKDETNPDDVEAINTEDSDDVDESAEMKRVHIKLPLDFDLSELAHNIMMNNEKSRMNCVVERRRTEEVADEPMKEMNPFNIFLNEPKKEKITGERIAIFCETGAPKTEPEPVVQIRRIVMPFNFQGGMHRFGPQMGPQQFQGPPPPQMSQFQGPPPQMNQFQGPPPQMNQFQGPPPQMNQFQGPPPQMNQFQGLPPQMNQFQGPPPPHMRPQFQGPSQMGAPQFPPQFPSQNQINIPPQFAPQNQMRIPFQPPQMSQMPFQAPQNNNQQLPPIPAQMMSPPRPEVPQFRLISPASQQQLPNFERPQENEQSAPQPEVRIHLRRIQIPGPIGDLFPFLNNINNDLQKEVESESPRQNVQMQQVPLAIALSKVGITPDDLRNIQRMAEEKFQEHIRELVADDDNDSSSDSESNQSEEEAENNGMQTQNPEQQSAEEQQQNQSNQELHEVSQQEQSDERPQILALGRSNFGRSLNPVHIPVPMTDAAEIQEAERSTFVHPR